MNFQMFKLVLEKAEEPENKFPTSAGSSKKQESSKEYQGEIRKPSLVIKSKEIEENSRIGKTRYLFKKIRDTKGTFHAKMGSIKDRNGMDLTESEDIKKR